MSTATCVGDEKHPPSLPNEMIINIVKVAVEQELDSMCHPTTPAKSDTEADSVDLSFLSDLDEFCDTSNLDAFSREDLVDLWSDKKHFSAESRPRIISPEDILELDDMLAVDIDSSDHTHMGFDDDVSDVDDESTFLLPQDIAKSNILAIAAVNWLSRFEVRKLVKSRMEKLNTQRADLDETPEDLASNVEENEREDDPFKVMKMWDRQEKLKEELERHRELLCCILRQIS